MQKNRIEVCGWLAAQPTQRCLPSGTPLASGRLGETYSYTAQEKAEQHTNWHSLSVYGDPANLAAAFDKRAHLLVEGSMEQREFPPAEGSKRAIWELIKPSFHLIGDPGSKTANRLPETVAASDGPTRDDRPVG